MYPLRLRVRTSRQRTNRRVPRGVSRKSFLGKVVGSDALDDRAWPTVALTSYGRSRGADIFRVHEARANFEALRMTEAIQAVPGP